MDDFVHEEERSCGTSSEYPSLRHEAKLRESTPSSTFRFISGNRRSNVDEFLLSTLRLSYSLGR